MVQCYDILLASGSPRRKELLTQAGFRFAVKTADVDETTEEKDPVKVVETLSRRKAEAVYNVVYSGEEKSEEIDKESCNPLVVAADTIVSRDGEILGKPQDEADACRMLRELSGRTHVVYTGVTLITPDGVRRTFSNGTKVKFYPLSEEEIREYVASGEPMDKAGAYGIQGLGARLVERIEGDYNNVVGFPLAHFIRVLEEEGLLQW